MKPEVRLATVVVVVVVVDELSDWDSKVELLVVSVSRRSVSDNCENREEGISSYTRKTPVSLRINVTPNVGKEG